MTKVFTVYVWEGDRLAHKAEDIVADCKEQVPLRAVEALRKRPGLYDDPALKAVANHYYIHTPWPDGVCLVIRHEIDKPEGPRIVFV